jgi:[protein-PII] uridylyltransferase
MQDFYRAAIAIERLSEQFLQRCEEAIEDVADVKPVRLNVDFVGIAGRLDCDPPDLLVRRPAALIDLFRVWTEHPEISAPRADLVRRIHEALDQVGADLPFDAEVNAAFARLLRKGAPAVEAMARMNHYGVLARYLPAFGRIVGRMQYDLFHAYTVDEHAMRVLRIVARFADAQTSREFAHAHELWSRLVKPELLLLAALFHDIAKGRGGATPGRRDRRARILRAPAAIRCRYRPRRMAGALASADERDCATPGHPPRRRTPLCRQRRGPEYASTRTADLRRYPAPARNCGIPGRTDCWPTCTSVRATCCAAGWTVTPCRRRVAMCRRGARLLREHFDDADVDRAGPTFGPVFPALHSRTDCLADRRHRPGRDSGATRMVRPKVCGQRTGFVYAPDRDGLFATLRCWTARTFRAGRAVVTSRSGMSLDTFLVLDAQGRAA